MNAPTRLLLVEDDESLRRVLARELGRMGFAVVAHDKGSGVLALLQQHEPAAVILDLHLPGVPGIDVLAQIVAYDADLPVVRRVVELAKKYGLFLHSHSDSDAVERHFQQDTAARVLWAHSGFERPEKVREMLRKHPNLYCDLAFLTSHASNGKVVPGWREAFLEFPDRFMVGTDSFTPERLHYIAEHARWSRRWLADLPKDVGEKIGYRNGERLFGGPPR